MMLPITVSLVLLAATHCLLVSAATSQASPAPALLLLTPRKAHRHVGRPAMVTVTALSPDNTPMPGVNVVISAFGDAKPQLEHLEQAATTTNAQGQASMYLTGQQPGAVAVVAATVTANGISLQSNPSHAFFAEDSSYLEHMERDYYHGGKHEHRWVRALVAVPDQNAVITHAQVF